MAPSLKMAFICFSTAVIIANCQAIRIQDSSSPKPGHEKLDSTEDKYVETILKDESDDKDQDFNEDESTKKSVDLPSYSFSLSNSLRRPFAGLQNMLKPNPKATVTSTKTLVLEVTKRVVKHPICIVASAGKPSCQQFHHSHGKDDGNMHEEKDIIDDDDDVWSDGYKNKAFYIEPTATLKMPTDTITIMPEFGVEDSETESARSGRYLEFDRATPEIPVAKSAINEEGVDELFVSDNDEPTDNMAKFFLEDKVTKHVTKTMWITRVQKVTDHKVTATFIPYNCIPSGTNIPHCPSQHHHHHHRSELSDQNSTKNDEDKEPPGTKKESQ